MSSETSVKKDREPQKAPSSDTNKQHDFDLDKLAEIVQKVQSNQENAANILKVFEMLGQQQKSGNEQLDITPNRNFAKLLYFFQGNFDKIKK